MEYHFAVKLLLPVAFAFMAMFTVTVQAQSSNKFFSLLPTNITARKSFPARFDCQTHGPGFIRWAVEERMMITDTSCPGCIPLSNYFPSVTQTHVGLYTCFIAGFLGVTPTYSVYLTFAAAPRITPVSPAIVTIIQNKTLEIIVSVAGVPQPDVTWSKDNVILNDDPRFTITGSNLRLSNAQRTDAGEYSVTAQNFVDVEMEYYNVIVQFPPIIAITRNPDSDMVEADTMVMVTCLVTSNPQSNISWEQVTANNRTDRTNLVTTLVSTDNTCGFNTVSSSIIDFANEDIIGFSTFCCIASNDIGVTTSCLNFTETDAQECSVTMVRGSVKYKRGRKSTRLIFSSDGDSRVTFQCKLDNKRFEDCTSPVEWRNLKRGKHTITVRGSCVDNEGKRSSTSRKFRFQVP